MYGRRSSATAARRSSRCCATPAIGDHEKVRYFGNRFAAEKERAQGHKSLWRHDASMCSCIVQSAVVHGMAISWRALARFQASLEFRQCDIREWEPGYPVDVILAGAVLQWIPGHRELLPRFASFLAPGGVLGFQVPVEFRQVDRIMFGLCTNVKWCGKLAGKRVQIVRERRTFGVGRKPACPSPLSGEFLTLGCPEGCSVGVGMPGRKGNATGNSVQSPVTGLSAAQRARKLGRGARRGASERRSRAITSDIERLKLLVERHPATSGDGPNLYGMQAIYWSRKALTSIWTANGSLVLSVR